MRYKGNYTKNKINLI